MRFFFARRLPAALLVAALASSAPRAQEPSPPGVIAPDERGGGGSGDRSPMIVPAPGDKPAPAPEAFGSGALPAEPAPAPAAGEPAATLETKEERLDALFAELGRQPVALIAEKTAARIEQEWVQSGSATVDLLMSRAASSMAKSDNAAALDLLDQVLVIEPDFPEAWNRRATLHFAMDNYGKSMVDIEQTLVREPRHFGALMGLALILERTERKQAAYETYLRVLAIYPTLRSAQEAAGRLADELTGPAI